MQGTEKFYPVKGFEDYYEITRSGKIKRKEGSVKQIYSNGEIISRKVTNKILKQDTSRKGYCSVCISINGLFKKAFAVHRLVALTFIPNPLNLPQINHKDGNKLNNNDWNLEWSTAVYNTNHKFTHLDHIGGRGVLSKEAIIDIFMNGIIMKKGIKSNYAIYCSKYNISPDSFRGVVSGEFYTGVTKHLKRKGETSNDK